MAIDLPNIVKMTRMNLCCVAKLSLKKKEGHGILSVVKLIYDSSKRLRIVLGALSKPIASVEYKSSQIEAQFL